MYFVDVDSGKTLGDTNNGYGFNETGMWFTGNASGVAYPVRCNFSFGETDVCEIVFTILKGYCTDHSVCLFKEGTDPEWSWGDNSSRIAVSVNCENPKIYGQTSDDSLGNISDGYYTFRVTYDPGAGTVTAVVHSGETTNAPVFGTMVISETLGSGNYRIGFDADQDDNGTLSYFTYLKVSRNGAELTGSKPTLDYIHPQYTFQVVTYTPQSLLQLNPLPDSLEHLILNLQQTDVFIGNKKYRHGDRFTAYGMEAIRLKQLYVESDNPVLKIYDPSASGNGSLLFNSTSALCTVPPSDDWAFGVQDFTIEWFQYFVAGDACCPRAFSINQYPTATLAVSFEPDPYLWVNNSLVMSATATNFENRWSHFAVTRNGTDLRMFQDGVQIGIVTNSDNITNNSDNLSIGSEENNQGASLFGGYITNFHVMKGVAKYTSDFTPPTSNIVPTSDSKLLLLAASQTAAFTDSSGNNRTLNYDFVSWSQETPF